MAHANTAQREVLEGADRDALVMIVAENLARDRNTFPYDVKRTDYRNMTPWS